MEQGLWYQFAFSGPGQASTGCDPAHPGGPFCLSGSGTPTSPAPSPPWTFSLLAPTNFIVVDAFASGDRFELFNGVVSLGLTSAPSAGADCGDDPIACLATPGMSSFAYALQPGDYTLTIQQTEGESGSGFFQVANVALEIPEPSTAALFLAAGIALFAVRTRLRA